MPFIGSVSGSRSGRVFPLGGKPEKVGTLSLSDGCTTATFSWTTPKNNGIPITKYGYQTSTDGGTTWSTETETNNLNASVSVGSANTTSYKMRVRAFNAAGWGPYSDASSSTTAWTYSSYAANYSVTRGCSRGEDCDSCGSKSGTEDGTVNRTCYQYTKSINGSACTQTNGVHIGVDCYFNTNNNESQSTSWNGNCRDLGNCSDSWSTLCGEAYPGYSYVGGDWLGNGCYYVVSGCESIGSCGAPCDGSNGYTISRCNTTGAYRVSGPTYFQRAISCGK